MKHRRGSASVLPTLMAAAAVLALASSGAYAQCVTSLPAGSIGPKTIVGQGPNGEKAASVDAVKLSDADIAKIKAGKMNNPAASCGVS
ncbi:hypothetical protein R75465_06907 [Paraburkholderia aspalathi]|uniref:hypothetical protein n=1 Tax=Paraburkholderia aspalathi TaxID=1324617 RepID=UPI001B0B6550|nr:hypothetical protein [Paraburkholderia aspalathi]CAE6845203.1 hypothetical protein R75465_06907 [Paraburkholderia aspalathi]